MTEELSVSPAIPDGDPIKINDRIFYTSLPYAAGHTLNEAEAAALNKTYKDRLVTNFKPKLEAMVKAAYTPEQIAEEFTAYAAGFSFAAPRERQSIDKVAELTERLAIDAVRSALAQRNAKWEDFNEAQQEVLLKRTLEKNGHAFRAEAERQLAERAKIMSDTLMADIV